jgi:hypothetical protein
VPQSYRARETSRLARAPSFCEKYAMHSEREDPDRETSQRESPLSRSLFSLQKRFNFEALNFSASSMKPITC